MLRTAPSHFSYPTGSLCCVAVSLLVACTSQSRPKSSPVETQLYADAIKQICDVDQLAGVTAESNELERTQKRDDFIIEHTKNSDAIYFGTLWRTKPPREKGQLLDQEARQLGIPRCELAATLRAE